MIDRLCSIKTGIIACMVLAALVSCGGSGSSSGGGAPAPDAFVISPMTKVLNQGDQFQFSASLNYKADNNIRWEILEGSQGGTVNSAGLYTAPPSLVGTFHLQATDTQSGRSSTASISVIRKPSISQFYIDPMIRRPGESANLFIQCSDGTPAVTYFEQNGPSGTLALSPPVNGVIKAPIPTSGSTVFYLVVTNQANAAVQKSAGAYVDPSLPGFTLPGEAIRLSQGNEVGTSAAPRVAIDGSGRAAMVWEQTDSNAVTSLRGSSFDPALGWTSGTILRAPYAQWPFFRDSSRIMSAANGQFIAAWLELVDVSNPNSTLQLVFSIFSPSTGWGPPVPVPVSNVFDFRLVCDSTGLVTFACETVEDGPQGPGLKIHRIRAVHYSPVMGWTIPQLVDSASALLSGVLIGDLKVSKDGRCWLSWVERYENVMTLPGTPTRSGVLVSSAWADGAWDQAVHVSDDSTFDQNVGVPQLAVDGQGTVHVARVASVLTDPVTATYRTDVHVNVFSPSTGWGSEMILANTSASPARTPERWLVCNAAGQAAVVWDQPAGGGDMACAKFYDPVLGWGESSPVQFAGNRTTAYSISLGSICLGIDDFGTVSVVWNEGDLYYDTYLSTRPAAGSWTQPAMISQRIFGIDGLVGTSQDILMDENGQGQAIFIWRQSVENGGTSIWSTYRGQ